VAAGGARAAEGADLWFSGPGGVCGSKPGESTGSDDSVPYSQVIEVNPATNEIVWKYQDKPAWNFFSPRMGCAQML
jgi:hypothetical protein